MLRSIIVQDVEDKKLELRYNNYNLFFHLENREIWPIGTSTLRIKDKGEYASEKCHKRIFLGSNKMFLNLNNPLIKTSNFLVWISFY